MVAGAMTSRLWWIVRKDIVCELRGQRIWPRMVLVLFFVAFLLTYQLDMTPAQRQKMAASLCWTTICMSAMVSIGPSIVQEQDDRCWEALRRYPVGLPTIYFAKLISNVLVLGTLQVVIIPFFAIACDTSWFDYPGRLALIGLLGNVGIASLETLLGALAAGIRQHHTLAVLLIPLLIPVVLGAAEATRLTTVSPVDSQGWRWTQLLAAFAIVFVTAGWAFFDFAAEDGC